MNRGVYLLIAMALILTALYFLLPQQLPGNTTPQSPGLTASQTATTSQTPQATTTAITPQVQGPPQGEANKTEQRGVETVKVRIAKFNITVEAPQVVNTTRLPITINYTVVVRNIGNGTGAVDVDGEVITLEPGQGRNLMRGVEINSAGAYNLTTTVNGTTYSRAVVVYYYTAVLIPEPVKVNVTRLPSQLKLQVRIKNAGNLTASINGVEIRPGQVGVVNATAVVNSTGYYRLTIGGVEVPIYVAYLSPILKYAVGGPAEIEAVPGEAGYAWLWIKNVGNASAEINVDGKTLLLAPGAEVNLTKEVTISKAGRYPVVFTIKGALNLTAVHEIKARIIMPRVQLVLWQPRLARSWPIPGVVDTTSVSVTTKDVALLWGYYITTNATSRRVTLIVQDPEGTRAYSMAPGQYVAKNFTTTAQPGTVKVGVAVNSSKYELAIIIELKPPIVSVRDIARIEFTDERPLYGLTMSCKYGSVSASPPIDILKVAGTVTYSQDGVKASGTITVRYVQTYTGDYSGQISGDKGYVFINILGHSIYVEFATAPTIEKILIDGNPVDCNIPIQLVPRALYASKPVAVNVTATYYAQILLNSLAKSDGDRPQSLEWTGEYVSVVDRSGRQLKVYFGQGEVRVEGPLTARVILQ